MAENIKIQLEDIYRDVTDDEVTTAKNYVLRRESAARGAESLIDALLEDAAEKITKIAYRYGIDPQRFQIASAYNKEMFKEMSNVLDDLEDEIMDITTSYSAKCTKDKDKKALLLLWLSTLGKGKRNLQQTLEDRLWMFSRDLEAMIVATKLAGYDVAKAVSRIKTSLHAVYVMPEMSLAFKESQKYKATYIRSRGVKYGNVGSSNSEANNIIRFVRTTIQMGWMHQLQENYEEKGAAGYIVLRGSTFHCDYCQDRTGFHDISDTESFPPQHPRCACYAVPVYEKDINEIME